MFSQISGGLLLITGAALILLAAIGVWRMPDLYTRMSAATKAVTLGASLMLLAAVMAFQTGRAAGFALAVVLFLLLTTPISAHLIGRAAYFHGIPLWDKSVIDALRQKGEEREAEREA